MDEPRRHVLNLTVENKSGVLARIAGLIAAKGYNIESLNVGETLDPSVSNMTIVVRGDEWVIEQATKQLNRLIDVIRVRDLTDLETVERELVLVRVKAKPNVRAELLRIADIFRARVVDLTTTTFTFEVTGDQSKNNAFLELVRPYGIRSMHRSGKLVMPRAGKSNQGGTRSE